ncbi:hypothetical protein NONI108955_23600 [Nocardia ninae]
MAARAVKKLGQFVEVAAVVPAEYDAQDHVLGEAGVEVVQRDGRVQGQLVDHGVESFDAALAIGFDAGRCEFGGECPAHSGVVGFTQDEGALRAQQQGMGLLPCLVVEVTGRQVVHLVGDPR